MVNITLFELHVHDGFDFSPSSVIGGDEEELDEYAEEELAVDADEESSGPGRGAGALVGLVVLVVLGLGIRKLMSDDLDPVEELEELDETIEA